MYVYFFIKDISSLINGSARGKRAEGEIDKSCCVSNWQLQRRDIYLYYLQNSDVSDCLIILY